MSQILDADYTFLNETLAKHYGIPGVSGSQWRKVDDVRKYGRGGMLGLASVQTQQAGASRTSPILRGNWVVETLLGEKLPRPPPNVPKLPEEEGGSDNLTMRQLVERHTKVAECAVCHQRIDPFGFALEKYDSIGRFRDKDLGGLAVDAKCKLKDGTEFEGIDGLARLPAGDQEQRDHPPLLSSSARLRARSLGHSRGYCRCWMTWSRNSTRTMAESRRRFKPSCGARSSAWCAAAISRIERRWIG